MEKPGDIIQAMDSAHQETTLESLETVTLRYQLFFSNVFVESRLHDWVSVGDIEWITKSTMNQQPGPTARRNNYFDVGKISKQSQMTWLHRFTLLRSCGRDVTLRYWAYSFGTFSYPEFPGSNIFSFVWLENYSRVVPVLLVSTLQNRWCSSRVIACYTEVTGQVLRSNPKQPERIRPFIILLCYGAGWSWNAWKLFPVQFLWYSRILWEMGHYPW